MFDNDNLSHGAVRLIGTAIGVLASLIMVAPTGTKAALYRVLIGLTMGYIFAPTMDQIWGLAFLSGDELDLVLARGAAAGFAVWFILEAVARFLSSTDWLVKLLRQLVTSKNQIGGGDE